MNTNRIEAIHKATAYPDSISVQQALLKVWNECSYEYEALITELEIRNAELVEQSMLRFRMIQGREEELCACEEERDVLQKLEPIAQAAISWYLSASGDIEPLSDTITEYFNHP